MSRPGGDGVEGKRGIRPRAMLVGFAALAIGAWVALNFLSTSPLAVVGALLLLLAVVTIASAVEIVGAYEKRALTVFGEYRKLLEPGINFVPPFVSKTHAYDMRTQTIDVPMQEAITRDNSPVRADAVVYIRVMDARKAYLEVDDYERATSNLAQTTLRAVLGDMELDETLKERSKINRRINTAIDEATDEWGIRVEAVEVRAVTPSQGVQSAMEQQTAAERRRRAMILEAQGERRSAVETAEGDKQSNVIRAQGEKQSQILEAQGDAVSTVLRARSAESMGERAVLDKGMDTLAGIGKGESTTFLMPQELTSMVGRYGKHLSGSDAAGDGTALDSLQIDAETRELLGLDDIQAILGGVEDVGGIGEGEAPLGSEAGAEIAGAGGASEERSDGGDAAERSSASPRSGSPREDADDRDSTSPDSRARQDADDEATELAEERER